MFTKTNEQLLRATAESWGIVLDDHQLYNFYILYQEIRAHNVTMNLTRIISEEDFVIKHLIDSLSVLPVLLEYRVTNFIDIGTGAGFPGLVIKLVCPALKTTLVDATLKKVSFLKHLVEIFRIENISALHGSAETLAHDHTFRERFDAAVCRALSQMRVLAEICLPFVRVSGILIAQKGKTCEQEVKDSIPAIHVLGGEREKTVSIYLPRGAGERKLVIIRKIQVCPKKYPRRPGIPRKNPI